MSKRATSGPRALLRRMRYSPRCTGAIAAFLTLFIRVYVKTLRLKFHVHPDFLQLDRNRVIYGLWHGRQFLLVGTMRHRGTEPPSRGTPHAAVMTDLSWAGEIQTRILERLGYLPVRGSSKRGGARALLAMSRIMLQGIAVGFALDGPRGPIYQSKPGILFLARKHGYPIVPLMAGAEKAWVLDRTWCRYMLPKPFSRCYVAFGAPLRLTPNGEDFTSVDLDRLMLEFMQESDRTFLTSRP